VLTFDEIAKQKTDLDDQVEKNQQSYQSASK